MKGARYAVQRWREWRGGEGEGGGEGREGARLGRKRDGECTNEMRANMQRESSTRTSPFAAQELPAHMAAKYMR